MKTWYVYKLSFPDSTFYYGYRGSKANPIEDLLVKYFSSSKIVKSKLEVLPATGEILHTTLVKEDAFNIEQTLIEKYLNDPMCLNQSCYFKRRGFGLVDDNARSKMSTKSLERWKDPEFKAIAAKKQSNSWTGERKVKHSELMKQRYSEGKSTQLMKGSKPGHNKGRKQSPEHIQNRTGMRLGSKHSEETKLKMSTAVSYTTCIYCGRQMSKSTCTRYHNENCNLKLILS
jgi:hypothetical protein